MAQIAMLICACGNRAQWGRGTADSPHLCHDCLAASLLQAQAEYDAIWHPNGRPRRTSAAHWDRRRSSPLPHGHPHALALRPRPEV